MTHDIPNSSEESRGTLDLLLSVSVTDFLLPLLQVRPVLAKQNLGK